MAGGMQSQRSCEMIMLVYPNLAAKGWSGRKSPLGRESHGRGSECKALTPKRQSPTTPNLAEWGKGLLHYHYGLHHSMVLVCLLHDSSLFGLVRL